MPFFSKEYILRMDTIFTYSIYIIYISDHVNYKSLLLSCKCFMLIYQELLNNSIQGALKCPYMSFKTWSFAEKLYEF